MTPTEQRDAWIARQLATSRPLTQEQQRVLRRVLLTGRRTA